MSGESEPILISADDESGWRKLYDDSKDKLESFSDHVLHELQAYKKAHPDIVRLVFSRDPKIKTFPSILGKIERI